MKRIFVSAAVLFALGLSAFTVHESKRAIKHRFFNDELNGKPYIIIDKSDYELKVYDDDGWYATYPVVLGSKSLDDKMIQGDRKTPEGVYKIASKRVHEKWDRMMLIDYPTKADIAKFMTRQVVFRDGHIIREEMVAKRNNAIELLKVFPIEEIV